MEILLTAPYDRISPEKKIIGSVQRICVLQFEADCGNNTKEGLNISAEG